MKEKKKIQYIVLAIVILLLLAINIRVFVSNYFDKKVSKENNRTNIVSTEEEDNKNRENKIASLNEKSRIQTYFGTYISYIESKQYEEAYNLLYDGFKQTYFPTIREFQKYALENYPDNISVNYTDISREGAMYIINAEIRDILNSNKQSGSKSIRVVIMEEDINKFKISFEV